MANYILKKDAPILRCSNWAMDVLYENLHAMIFNNDLLFQNDQFEKFILKLNQETYGRGCIYVDIIDYIDEKNLQNFAMLVNKVIEKIKKTQKYDDDLIALLHNFKENIL